MSSKFFVFFFLVQASLAAPKPDEDKPAPAADEFGLNKVKESIDSFFKENKIEELWENMKNKLKEGGEAFVSGTKDLTDKIKSGVFKEEKAAE